MNTNSTQAHSPLNKSLSRVQTICILVGVLLMIAVSYGLLSRSKQPQGARAVAVEMSTANRDGDSDSPITTVTEAPPGSHEQQVKDEILNNMRHGAESQR